MYRIIRSPEKFVHRVAWGPDPHTPPEWGRAMEDGTFGDRFGDPRQADGVPPEHRFRMIYYASERVAAYGETIARFRVPLGLFAGMESIIDNDDDPPVATHRNLFGQGYVPRPWQEDRSVGGILHDSSNRFVDLGASETLSAMRSDPEIARRVIAAGYHDLDQSVVMGGRLLSDNRVDREITQWIAVHLMLNAESFDGIRYISRLDQGWECWAIRADRLKGTRGMSIRVPPDDPDLLAAASHLGLGVASIDGSIIPSQP